MPVFIHKMSFSKSYIFILGLILICDDCFVTSVFGKRGCSSFGHSCYGGHGKRSGGVNGPHINSATMFGIAEKHIMDDYLKKHLSKLVAPHVSDLQTLLNGPPPQNLRSFLKTLVKPSNERHHIINNTPFLNSN